MVGARIPLSFYERDTLLVAREMLGCLLRHDAPDGSASGIILETEGYLEHGDLASHARFGRTQRSHVLFGPPGHAYIYFVYGMHYLFNVVTESDKTAGGVLVRALEPVTGQSLMMARRGTSDERNLTNGPGRLTQALSITREQNQADLTKGPLGIWKMRRFDDSEVMATPRIGVGGSTEEPYRYVVKGNPNVSGRSQRRGSK